MFNNSLKNDSINNDKILIEIAAYHEPELLNTINSALIQADNKDRVCFAICFQGDDLTGYDELKSIPNCKTIYLNEEESRGSCYARYLCQSLIDDEKYIYQIDAHMRFIKHWDTRMIKKLLDLDDEKAILSCYPPNCKEEMMKLPLDDEVFSKPTKGTVIYSTGFRDEPSYFLSYGSTEIDNKDIAANIRTVFMSAGNFFSFSEVHKQVKTDPELYFYGDELPMSIRLFTYGWNIYNMGECYIYHQYNRKDQRFSKVDNYQEKENNRFAKLLRLGNDSKDLGEFDLGNIRTLDEYMKYSGVDFKNRILYMNAEVGEIENKDYIGQLSYYQKQMLEENKQKNKKFEVLLIDLLGDYTQCIKRCLKNARYKEKINFIVGTISNKDVYKEKYQIKEIVKFNKGSTYCQILSSISKYVENSYIIIIDSSMSLLKDWDSYYSNWLLKCCKNSVLTGWVWNCSNDLSKDSMSPYVNLVKILKCFDAYLPVLEYSEDIDLTNRKIPYFNPIISDGLLVMDSSIIKKIPIDPNLNFNTYIFIYSLRLWTYGINIYYPPSSFAIRFNELNTLNNSNNNYDVICGLLRINNRISKYLSADYSFGFGKERPLWGWFDHLGYDFNLRNEYLNPNK